MGKKNPAEELAIEFVRHAFRKIPKRMIVTGVEVKYLDPKGK